MSSDADGQGTLALPNVVPLPGAMLVAFAIRSGGRIAESERKALLDRLSRLPEPDTAAGRLVADWLAGNPL